MNISRNSVLNAIVRRSQRFPNCDLKRVGNELEIILYNSIGEVAYIFKADVSDWEKKANTYYETFKRLSENPEIRLKCDQERKKWRKTIIL